MITIRPATSADLSQLVALDQEIFASYGADESPTVIAARLVVYPAGCAVLEEKTSASSSQILGYLTSEKWDSAREPALDEDPYLTHQPNGSILNITTLAIAPQHQQRGLGAHLLAHAITLATNEKCTQILLETAWAERFYTRHGFIKIGERLQRNILLHIMSYVVSNDV